MDRILPMIKVFFAVDLSKAAGLGHLSRCVALADMLDQRNHEIFFIVANKNQIKSFKRLGKKYNFCLYADIFLDFTASNVLLIDEYKKTNFLDSLLQLKWTITILIYDGQPNFYHTTGYISFGPKSYPELLGFNNYFYGDKLFPIRNEIINLKNRIAITSKKKLRVLYYSSAFDESVEGKNFINGILNSPRINTVVTRTSTYRKIARKTIKIPHKLRFSDCIENSDVAITSSGVIFWELTFLQKPTIYFLDSNDQIYNFTLINEFSLGHTSSVHPKEETAPQIFLNKFDQLIDPKSLDELRKNQINFMKNFDPNYFSEIISSIVKNN